MKTVNRVYVLPFMVKENLRINLDLPSRTNKIWTTDTIGLKGMDSTLG